MQGSLLVRHASAAVADAFCATRIGGNAGLAFGTLALRRDYGRDPGTHVAPAGLTNLIAETDEERA